MKLFLLCSVISVALLSAAQAADNSTIEIEEEDELAMGPCPGCLYPLWFNASTITGKDLCEIVEVEDAFSCLDTCILQAKDKPEAFLIRQLTQFSDILYSLKNSSCPLDSCSQLLNCFQIAANYEGPGGTTTHAPYNTVFNYNCSKIDAAISCVASTPKSCYVNDNREATLNEMVSLGMKAACDNPRRCLTAGQIYEVKPGSDCLEFYAEATAKGPSRGKPKSTISGTAFDPVLCLQVYNNENFTCPQDPDVTPIFSEFPEGDEFLDDEEGEEEIDLADIEVDTKLPCERCLLPVWARVVSHNGTYMCSAEFQSLVTSCLEACVGSLDSESRKEQLNTETMIKVADINKAFLINGCQAYSGCTSASLSCAENLVNFEPLYTNHVTVNNILCSEERLQQTKQCFSAKCSTLSSLFNEVMEKGYSSICRTDMRCLTYGTIYQYAKQDEVTSTKQPYEACAFYRPASANGWKEGRVTRTNPGLLFNMNNCQQDWPFNVECTW